MEYGGDGRESGDESRKGEIRAVGGGLGALSGILPDDVRWGDQFHDDDEAAVRSGKERLPSAAGQPEPFSNAPGSRRQLLLALRVP